MFQRTWLTPWILAVEMVEFGVPIWIGGVLKGFHRELENARENNVSFIELSIDYPWPYKETDLLKEVLSIIDSARLKLSIHAPWRDLPFSTPYRILGDSITELILDSINKVKSLYQGGIQYVVIHPFTMQKIELFNNRRDIIENTRVNLEKIINSLRENNCNVPVLLENLTRGFASEVSNLVEVVESLEDTGICLDIGHLASRFYRELAGRYSDFYEYLDEVANILKGIPVLTIHIHDVDRNGKEHLMIGEGVLEFKRIFKIISRIKPVYVVFEVFNSRKERNITLKKILKNIGEQISWGRIYLH